MRRTCSKRPYRSPAEAREDFGKKIPGEYAISRLCRLCSGPGTRVYHIKYVEVTAHD
jgi:hypothetical protein